jgi:hypothetical protein
MAENDLVLAPVDLTTPAPADLIGADLTGADLTAPVADATATGDLTAPAGDLTAGPADMVTCATGSCGTDTCGASFCGFHCGTCMSNKGCLGGTCVTLNSCPGTPCVDAFGGNVCEGNAGLRVCPTDNTKFQRCVCSGGGASAWITCAAGCN